MHSVFRDLRLALRRLARQRLLAAVAVVTLALGIGANAAIFSVLYGVLIRPLPYDDPGNLALLWQRSASTGSDRLRIPAPDVAGYRERSESFADLTFVAGAGDALLGTQGSDEHVRVGRVAHNFFSTLGVEPALGRAFIPGEAIIPVEALEDTAFVPPASVLLLSHSLWRGRFGGDPRVIGETVLLNDQLVVVVGVLPAEFELLLPPDVGLSRDIDAWTPLRFELSAFRRDEGRWRDQDSDNTGAVIGRLASRVTLDQAQAEMDAIAAQQRELVPFYRQAGMWIDVRPLHGDAVRHVRPTLFALMGAVVVVLLIACFNVAGVLLSQAESRRTEMAMRIALGASRARLIGQVLVESALLAVAGGAAGLLLANWLIELLLSFAPSGLPRSDTIGVHGPVLLFTGGLSLLSVLFFGSFPALHLSTQKSLASLRSGARGLGTRTRTGLRRSLVVTEIALSMMLLVGAGLLLRSVAELHRVRLGFDPQGLLTFRVTLPPGTVGGPGERARLMHEFTERLRTIPGVRAVGLVGGLPLGGAVWTQPFGLEGQPEEEWGANEANFRSVTSDYFRAMGTRLLAGRFFSEEEDLVEEDRVVIVDETLAARVGSGGDVLGRTIGFPLDGSPTWATIVGVVEEVRHEDIRVEGRPTIYVPYRQEASRAVAFAVRTRGPPMALAPMMRGALDRVATEAPVPVFDLRGMDEYVARSLAPTHFALALIGAFGGVALVLALVGIYGVVAHSVSRRTREIAVRMALGARQREVLRGEMGWAMALVGIGLLIGLLLAGAGSWVARSLLFGVAPIELRIYLVTVASLAAVAALACFVPARRAAAVLPMEALRDQ